MISPGLVLFCVFLFAMSVSLKIRFAAGAKSQKHVDDCAGAATLTKKGTVHPENSDTTWNLVNPFYAEVEFNSASEAAASLKGAVLCYTEPSSASTLKASWPENEGLTKVTSDPKVVQYVFNTVSPSAARGRKTYGTGKGTIIITQGAQKFLVNGELDGLTHTHRSKPDHRRHATIWPPVASASTIQASSTAPSGAGAQWHTDQPYHVQFKYQTTSNAANFQAAQLVYVSDDSTHTAYWPMTYASLVSTNLFGVPTGVIDLFFRPYSAPIGARRPRLLGTGKGTIIITQNVAGVLVDSVLAFNGGVTQFALTGP